MSPLAQADMDGQQRLRRPRAATVSYTHLDVYKRQILICLIDSNQYWNNFNKPDI